MFPEPFRGDLTTTSIQYYQSVMTSQAAIMLLAFIVLKIVHFALWGYDEENKDKDQPSPDQHDPQPAFKWDQKSWDLYFPIVFANHIAALALPICYIPFIYSIVIAYMHFICFSGLVIVNIFIKDEQTKKSRTLVSRILWALMCLFNIMLIIGGLTGVSQVLA